MDQAVLEGKPTRTRSSFSDEDRRESFLMGMFNSAMAIAPALSKQLPLDGCTRLLDFGGGPGTYGIHFCMQHPGLTPPFMICRPLGRLRKKQFNGSAWRTG
jgi:hypothetical protein